MEYSSSSSNLLFRKHPQYFAEFQTGKQRDECRSLMWQEFSLVPACSLLGWGWWRGQAGNGSSPRQGWVRADLNTGSGSCWGSLGFPQEGWKERSKRCSRKNSCSPQCACERRAVTTLHHCGMCQLLQFPGTNGVKFSCLGNVQLLKLRVFLSKIHKINYLPLGACFAHWEWMSGFWSSHMHQRDVKNLGIYCFCE